MEINYVIYVDGQRVAATMNYNAAVAVAKVYAAADEVKIVDISDHPDEEIKIAPQDMPVIATYETNNFGGIEVAAIDDQNITWRWNFGIPEVWQTVSSHDGEWFWADDEPVAVCELCRVGF